MAVEERAARLTQPSVKLELKPQGGPDWSVANDLNKVTSRRFINILDATMTQNRLCLLILLLGLLQCVLLLLIALSPVGENVNGLPHPTFGNMQIGGDGLARFLPVARLAYWFQILVLAQICCMIALGVRRDRQSKVFWGWLVGSFSLLAGAWTAMYVAYETFLTVGETVMIAGWPYPTAWQVYAIWLSGLGLVGLYVFGFKVYVWSDQDELNFKLLVKQYGPVD